MSSRAIAIALMGIVGISGCSLAPKYEHPSVVMPSSWEGGAHPKESVFAGGKLSWDEFVLSKNLKKSIQIALENNKDLKQALINLEATQRLYGIQRADRFLQLEAQAGGSRQRIPADLSQSGEAIIQHSYSVGLGVSAFELDLFGRVKSLSEAALEEYLATKYASYAVRIALVGEVMRVWIERQRAHERVKILLGMVDSHKKSQSLIKERYEKGASGAMEYQEAVNLAIKAQMDRYKAQAELQQAENALVALLGLKSALELPAMEEEEAILHGEITPYLPSELLQRRPDIGAAEHRLKSKYANIGAARAAFFPRITLTANGGSSSESLSKLFDGGSGAWSFAPQITLPIFDAGKNQNSLELAKLRRDEALVEYERSIEIAFKEVKDALSLSASLHWIEKASKESMQNEEKRLKLSASRYSAGMDSHVHYLEAERRWLSERLAWVEAKSADEVAMATLFKVLGGGWNPEEILGEEEGLGANKEE